MSFKPIILLLGAGPRTGRPIADLFAAAGYNVACCGRSLTTSKLSPSRLDIQLDLAKPETVSTAFEKVMAEFHSSPNVVVYTAAAFSSHPASAPFSLPPATFAADQTVNVTSLYAAMGAFVTHAEKLPASVPKTFVLVGNKLIHGPLAGGAMTPLGVGKSAGAYLVQVGADVYGKGKEGEGKNFRFYFADERRENGDAVYGDIDGKAHGEYLLELAGDKEKGQRQWEQTFVKGQGYVDFNGK